MCDMRRDLRSIASEVCMSFEAVQSILTDILGMSKVSARWVLRMLTDDQKKTRLDISSCLLFCYEDDPGDFIEQVVTQDETWVHHFDPESKMQSKHWKQPDSSPPKMVQSAGNVMATIVWNSQGVVMVDYLEQGRTIKGAYYAGKLRRLRQKSQGRGKDN